MKNSLFTGAISLTATLFLTACQSSSQTKMEWRQIGPGPTFEVAKAQCEIASAGTQQGLYAQGTPGYVLGAQLGNAIANDARKEAFIKQCLVINGWQQVAVPVGVAGKKKV